MHNLYRLYMYMYCICSMYFNCSTIKIQKEELDYIYACRLMLIMKLYNYKFYLNVIIYNIIIYNYYFNSSQIKYSVSSPGGTTIKGLQVMEDKGVRGALIGAVQATAEKTFSLK